MKPDFVFRCLPIWIGLFTALVFPVASHAAPRSELWQRWQVHDGRSDTRVDHRAWDRFLDRYVVVSPDGINRVDYADVTNADKGALQSYIDGLTGTAVSALNRDEQKAYWINLYNALTVRLILDHYPLTSIRKINISPGFFSSGPWDKKLVTVESEKVSLNDIEHRILRPIWKDARVHYAINCASIGCPNLQRRAFTADNMEALLDRAARAYINHPRGARVEGGKLYVSSIYEWFREDFGGTDRGVIEHLRQFAAPNLTHHLKGITGIAGDAYDWSLNESKP